MYDIQTNARGLVAHGVSTCHGCGLELAVRIIMSELGEKTIIVIPPGCAALFSGYGDETALKIPGFQGNLENTAAYASGIKAGLEFQGKDDVTVLGLAGDGGTVDIGLQALSGALERKDKILYICYDNEAYMNTGVQGSGSTPYRARTTTTPAGKASPPKDMIGIAVSHGIPYAATASIAYPVDFRRKLRYAKDVQGPVYIHLHTPCPTGWGYPVGKTIKVARLAVETCCWPLYDVKDGVYSMTKKVSNPRPLGEYLELQKRFRGLMPDEVEALESYIKDRYEMLLKGCN
jgi:pyruvate ferredoxin oxidoreductase beta subunit